MYLHLKNLRLIINSQLDSLVFFGDDLNYVPIRTVLSSVQEMHTPPRIHPVLASLPHTPSCKQQRFPETTHTRSPGLPTPKLNSFPKKRNSL
uniref:Uncharacterized protein n=1 Tax=Anguilla anguilla TaxID=7936 RepID=A0A0E9X0W5_ANGAN